LPTSFGSGGDALPWLFKQAKLGTLAGTRDSGADGWRLRDFAERGVLRRPLLPSCRSLAWTGFGFVNFKELFEKLKEQLSRIWVSSRYQSDVQIFRGPGPLRLPRSVFGVADARS
jgi:hypothetical protein